MALKWSKKFQLKSGKWVYVPTPEMVTLGRVIKRGVEGRWHRPSYYYHLRRGGHVHALKSHIGNSIFVRLDIRDFFGSINRTRVTRSLKLRFGYKKAREWANASTVLVPEIKRYIVPFGFVQSPIIASLCLNDSALGRCLTKLRRNRKFAVSVYVDDIIVSCKAEQGEELHREVLPSLQEAAARARLEFSQEKSEGPAAEITAFNIDLSHGSMRVEEGRMNDFAAALEKSESELERAGIIGYVKSVNDEQANAMAGTKESLPPAH
jgi:hypothetical protein